MINAGGVFNFRPPSYAPADLGRRLLHASSAGSLVQVGALLNQGAVADWREDPNQFTPLMFASIFGHRGVAAILLDRGALVNALNGAGMSAFHLASMQGHVHILQLLEARGAEIHISSIIGANTILRVAYKCIAVLRSRTALLERASCANASMLFSEQFSDVVFLCSDGERIHAHRCIVAACSPLMRAMLQGSWMENVGKVSEVPMTQSAPAVRALLRFFYTGEVDEATVQSQMSDVLHLAAQHEQPKLTAACAKCAANLLSVQTVVPILVVAHLHDLPSLKARCVDLITTSFQNIVAVTLSSSFMELKTMHPLLWRKLRAALGLPEEEGDDEEDEGSAQDNKRARLEK